MTKLDKQQRTPWDSTSWVRRLLNRASYLVYMLPILGCPAYVVAWDPTYDKHIYVGLSRNVSNHCTGQDGLYVNINDATQTVETSCCSSEEYLKENPKLTHEELFPCKIKRTVISLAGNCTGANLDASVDRKGAELVWRDDGSVECSWAELINIAFPNGDDGGVQYSDASLIGLNRNSVQTVDPYNAGNNAYVKTLHHGAGLGGAIKKLQLTYTIRYGNHVSHPTVTLKLPDDVNQQDCMHGYDTAVGKRSTCITKVGKEMYVIKTNSQ